MIDVTFDSVLFFTDIDIDSQLRVACESGDVSFVKSAFESHGANIVLGIVGGEWEHPGAAWGCIHFAASNGQISLVDFLLSVGENVDREDDLGATPLYHAAEGMHNGTQWEAMGGEAKNVETLKFLLEKGANVNTVESGWSEWNWTALHIAAYWGNSEIVQTLLLAGADVEAKTKFGETPLQLAIDR